MSPTEVVRTAVDAINRQDIAALREAWAPDIHVRFPDADCHGADAAIAYFQAAFAAMPDMRLEIQALAEHGETVFMRWRMTGQHTGAAWNGIAASGRRVELDGMDHFEIRDGRVASNFVVYDQMQFARAVGLVPQDGSPGDRALKAAFAARIRVTEKLRG
jgi:steroid delta-isomerase-like uncharacterized protein